MITLNDIVQTKRFEVVQLYAPTHDFVGALKAKATNSEEVAVIGEYKRASPSAGDINLTAKVEDVVKHYEQQSAAAISILTDTTYFKGNIAYLQQARAVTQLPLLRKDFIIDSIQIYESKLAGADAILLIAAILTDQQLQVYTGLAHSLHMQVLLEVHTETELERGLLCEPDMIGVNSRDLDTMVVDTTVFERLITKVPAGKVVVAESGIEDMSMLKQLKSLGYTAALIGSHFMRNL